jgi:hypothetical protein
MKKLSYIALASIALFSCDPEFDESVNVNQKDYSAGDADFSSFVTLGNSLTSGFADNALYLDGQKNSFPNILAGQFSLVGGGDFTQPLVSDNLGGFTVGGVVTGTNRLVLNSQLSPVPVEGIPTTEISNVISGPFNNVGVPGAKSYHLTFPGYAALNPYYTRFASSPTATVLEDALANNPTFYSLWIGNNDILGYASTGGTGVDQNEAGNLDPSAYAGNDISHAGVVQVSIAKMVEDLNATGAKGVICNIPNVTDIPFFTTVPYNALDPNNPSFGSQIPTLNGQFAPLNAVFNALGAPERAITYNENSANPVLRLDESLTDLSANITAILQSPEIGLPAGYATVLGLLYGQSRPATAEDLLVLTSSGVIGTPNTEKIEELVALGLSAEQAAGLAVNGITLPLEDRWVLTAEEYNHVETARTQYNSIINSIAYSYENVIVADMASGLNQLNTSGISYNGGTLYSTFATGGGFSLDGVHPSAQGYAAKTNIFIETVNEKRQSSM